MAFLAPTAIKYSLFSCASILLNSFTAPTIGPIRPNLAMTFIVDAETTLFSLATCSKLSGTVTLESPLVPGITCFTTGSFAMFTTVPETLMRSPAKFTRFVRFILFLPWVNSAIFPATMKNERALLDARRVLYGVVFLKSLKISAFCPASLLLSFFACSALVSNLST